MKSAVAELFEFFECDTLKALIDKQEETDTCEGQIDCFLAPTSPPAQMTYHLKNRWEKLYVDIFQKVTYVKLSLLDSWIQQLSVGLQWKLANADVMPIKLKDYIYLENTTSMQRKTSASSKELEILTSNSETVWWGNTGKLQAEWIYC